MTTVELSRQLSSKISDGNWAEAVVGGDDGVAVAILRRDKLRQLGGGGTLQDYNDDGVAAMDVFSQKGHRLSANHEADACRCEDCWTD